MRKFLDFVTFGLFSVLLAILSIPFYVLGSIFLRLGNLTSGFNIKIEKHV